MSLLEQQQLVNTDTGTLYEATLRDLGNASSVSTQPSLRERPSESFQYRFLKRGLDIALVLAALPVVLPSFAMIGALLAIDSPGPVFFSHRRLRKNGHQFRMWKLRTMRKDASAVLEEYFRENPEAHNEWLSTHKLRHDPRVTRFGAFLRRTSLDELPQIWNVLNGTMSLVGPRPIVAAEVEKYGNDFEQYCCVKPGLTGLWQVSGRSKLSYATRVEMDCIYVKRWSLWGDMVILIKTISAVRKQEGAF